MIDLVALEVAARAATPGEWEAAHAGEGTRNGGFVITEHYVRMPGANFALAADIVGADMKPSASNAAYIAAANPAAVLALSAELRQARQARMRAAGLGAVLEAILATDALREYDDVRNQAERAVAMHRAAMAAAMQQEQQG